MEKQQGMSRRNKLKAQKEQEKAEKADHEKRRSMKRDKQNQFLDAYANKGSDEDSDEFMDNHSICSDSTGSFNEDLKNSADITNVSSADHENWKTYDDYLIEEDGDVDIMSTQYCDKADAILAKVKVESPVPRVIDLTADSSPEQKKLKLSKEEIKKKKRRREKERISELSNKFINEHNNLERDALNDSYQYADQYYYDEDEENQADEVTEVDDVNSGEHDQPVVEEESIIDDTTVSTLTGKGNYNVEEDEQEQEALMDRGVLTKLQQRRSPNKRRRLTIPQIRQMNNEKKKNT